jgi:hypothetical protein
LELKVHVNDVHGSQIAAKITGIFTLDGKTFRFNAIAFGRIGGHNIGAKISKTTEREIKKMGYNIDEVIDMLQQKLVRGDITIPEGIKKETFADG